MRELQTITEAVALMVQNIPVEQTHFSQPVVDCDRH